MQIAVLLVLALLVLTVRALQFALLTRQVQWGYDFSAYWQAGQAVLAHASPYQQFQLDGPYSPQQQYLYLYPPPLAAFVAPLAAVFSDYRAAAWIWTGLGAVILAASVLALWRSERLGDRFPLLAGRGRWLLVAAAFAYPPVVGELVLGNVHLVLLGLLTAAWLGIRKTDSEGTAPWWRGDWRAGIGVGLAALIKVFPGVLLLWFLLQRRWRAIAGLVFAVVAAIVVTLPITGVQPWLDYPTVLANLGPPVDTRDTLAPTVWLGDVIGFSIARLVVTVVGLAILAWTAVRGWASSSGASATGPASPSTARSFAIAVTISILIAPAMYQHYLALLVLPLILGLASGVPVAWLAVSYFLMWGGQQDALGAASWLVDRAMPTAGALVLLISLLMGSRRRAVATAPATA